MIKTISMERLGDAESCVIEFEHGVVIKSQIGDMVAHVTEEKPPELLSRAMKTITELLHCIDPESQATVQETNEAAEKARELLAEWAPPERSSNHHGS